MLDDSHFILQMNEMVNSSIHILPETGSERGLGEHGMHLIGETKQDMCWFLSASRIAEFIQFGDRFILSVDIW